MDAKNNLSGKSKTRPLTQALLNQEFAGTGGLSFKLKNLAGRKAVLYFYPKDDTPGCTAEGADFTRLYAKFQKAGAEVFGISRDPLASHERFKKKYQYKVELISDPNAELCKAFDVLKEKTMFGKKAIGLERSTFVLDSKGQAVKEWRKVKVPGHAEEVLKFVQQL